MRLKAVAGLTVGLMMIGSVAIAHAPTVTITAPTDGDLIQLETTDFPYSLPVAGTIAHVGSSNTVTLNVTVNSVNQFSQGYIEPDNVAWGFNYSVTAPGTYTIVASSAHGGNVGSDDAEVEVEDITQTVIVDYPAAPSVANSLLKDAGLGNSIGKGKNQINLISAVAGEMGPGTTFHGEEKSNVDDYRDAVKAFLNTFPEINL